MSTLGRLARLDCDYLAALLSTDWFLAHWGELNLIATIDSRRRVQNVARQIVTQFMGGKTNYPSIDLAHERRAKTCEQLQRAISEHVGLQLDEPAKSGAAEQEDKTLFWLLETITLEVVKRSNPESLLSPAQFTTISDAFALTLDREQPLDLEFICLSSDSDWDATQVPSSKASPHGLRIGCSHSRLKAPDSQSFGR